MDFAVDNTSIYSKNGTRYFWDLNSPFWTMMDQFINSHLKINWTLPNVDISDFDYEFGNKMEYDMDYD